MSQRQDGGLAFPGRVMVPDYADPDTGHVLSWRGEERNGMSLRDWFAGQALAGIAGVLATASQASIDEAAKVDGFSGTRGQYTAKRCYAIADAMLEERDK